MLCQGKFAIPFVPKRNRVLSMATIPPSIAPVNEPARPCMAASITNIRTIKRSSAPRHFMVPISRKRSVTDINWALIIPTTQTSRERITIQRCLGEAARLVSPGFISYPQWIRVWHISGSPVASRLSAILILIWLKARKETARTRVRVVTRERKKRALMDL